MGSPTVPSRRRLVRSCGCDPLHAPGHEGADGGGGAVKNGDLVAIDNFPEAIALREVRSAFVHHDAGAVGKRAVDDVAVAGDPADVGGAPIDVVIAQIENQSGAPGALEQVAGGSVQDALRFSGGAAGVENVERMFGIEGGGDVILRLFLPGRATRGRALLSRRPPPWCVARRWIFRWSGNSSSRRRRFLSAGRFFRGDSRRRR